MAELIDSQVCEFEQEVVTDSMENVLRFLQDLDVKFPNWKLYLDFQSIVDETNSEVDRVFEDSIFEKMEKPSGTKFSKMTDSEVMKYFEYFECLDAAGFYDNPVPDVDELRKLYKEGTLERRYLELKLSQIQVDVKKALRLVYRRAFGPVRHDEEKDALKEFKEGFSIFIQELGISYDPVKVVLPYLDYLKL